MNNNDIKNDYFKQFSPHIYSTWRISEIINNYNDYFNKDNEDLNNIDIKIKDSVLGESLEIYKRYKKLNDIRAIEKYKSMIEQIKDGD